MEIHERQKYQPQRITVSHTHMQTGTQWQRLAQRLIEHLFVHRTTRPTCRWGGAAEKNQPICTTGKQETQQGVQQNRCSGSGWSRQRGCREKIKGVTDRKRVKMSVASSKDSGTAASWAVRQQVNTNRSSTSLLWFCWHTQPPLGETN